MAAQSYVDENIYHAGIVDENVYDVKSLDPAQLKMATAAECLTFGIGFAIMCVAVFSLPPSSQSRHLL
jgi:hypothetical protein